MIELDNIYLEDCLEGMKRIADHSIDAVICDLPYGTTANSWDSVIPFEELWGGYKRIIKENGAIVLFSQQPFTSALVMSNPKMFKYEWIWEKPKASGFLQANKSPLKAHENILIFYCSLPTYNPQGLIRNPHYNSRKSKNERSKNYGDSYGYVNFSEFENYPRDLLCISHDNANDCIHPTQKPVALIQYLVRTYTNRGDTVLDNCMGSGTTAIACIREHRHYIGFETCREYWEKSLKRIEDEKRQLTFDFGEM